MGSANASHQTGYLGPSLDEAENIVDEQQHIAMFVVPEILGHGQGRVADAETGARRLVHLAEHHNHVGQDTGRLHVTIQFLPFATRPLRVLERMAEAEQALQRAVTDIPTAVCERLAAAHALSEADHATIIEIARAALASFLPAPASHASSVPMVGW